MIRSFRLAQIAVQAEGLRLRRLARRTAVRVGLVVVAAPFLLACFAFLETALWDWLSQNLRPEFAALITAGINFAIAGLLLLIAALSRDSQVEIEALRVRQRALEDATRQLTIAATVAPFIRLLLDQLRRRRDKG
jgi:hypothetical protein